MTQSEPAVSARNSWHANNATLDDLDDVFETHTADEDAVTGDEREQHEEFEDQALSGTVAVSLTELEAERLKVEALLNQARQLFNTGEESKFEKSA